MEYDCWKAYINLVKWIHMIREGNFIYLALRCEHETLRRTCTPKSMGESPSETCISIQLWMLVTKDKSISQLYNTYMYYIIQYEAKSCLSDFNVYTNILGILSKSRFWVNKSGIGPMKNLANKLPWKHARLPLGNINCSFEKCNLL